MELVEGPGSQCGKFTQTLLLSLLRYLRTVVLRLESSCSVGRSAGQFLVRLKLRAGSWLTAGCHSPAPAMTEKKKNRSTKSGRTVAMSTYRWTGLLYPLLLLLLSTQLPAPHDERGTRAGSL